MANLDEHIREAEQDDLGTKMAQEAKGKVKNQAKQGIRGIGRHAASRFKKSAAGQAVKKGMKAGRKALFKAGAGAAKSALSFLASNPAGWIVSGCLIVGGLTLAGKLESYQDQAAREVSSHIEEGTGADGTSEYLTEDGVVVLMSDCPEEKEAAAGDIDTDMTMEANARMLYSVFKGYGLTDECIAGMLGNFQVEGSIDPTTLEGIYTEPHQIGKRKKAALENLNSYTSGKLFGLYAKCGIGINRGAYKASDGKYYCGLGLVQWTGPGAYDFLSVGRQSGQEWYSMEYQLAYMLSDAHYRPGFFANWKANPSGSAEEAGTYFAHKYEGNTKLAQNERREYAEAWLSKMSSWTIDEALNESIVSLSGVMGAAAADMAMGERKDNCPEDVGAYDNSSIASAAVSYAYPTKAQGKKNNGTALYQQVHRNIFPGDSWFMSCDRSVACAIRWSGSDDTFPPGNTNNQYDYMQASPKWQSIGKTGSLSMDALQPGDIFILDGHVFMFTGAEIIQQIHGSKAEANSDSVSGSLNDRSPGCGNDSTDIIVRKGGQDWSGRGQYEVFRCILPDQSQTYANAGGSAALK